MEPYDASDERLQHEHAENYIVGLFDAVMFLRLVFVDFVGLMCSWCCTPMSILSACCAVHFGAEIKMCLPSFSLSECLCIDDSDKHNLCALMTVLRWKDAQGLVFWMLKHTRMVAPFNIWVRVCL